MPPYIWFLIKTFAVIFTLMWIRGTWPRFRIDQMLDLAWKVLVPLSLVNILLVGVVIKLSTSQLTWLAILLPANVIIGLVTLVVLGKVQNRRLARARELAAQGWVHHSSVEILVDVFGS